MNPGILLIDKPQGLTSFALIRHLRRVTKSRSFGHTGTLDPLATGMLPILCGSSTRFASYIQSQSKRYTATIQFGQATDTDDSDGQITDTSSHQINEAALCQACQHFLGTYMQKPPLAAAIKVNGKKLYEYLRKNEPPPKIPYRKVTLTEITLISFDPTTQTATIEVECGSGTYIRALARDIGLFCNTYGHITALRRLWVTPFHGHPIIPLSRLTTIEEINSHITPVIDAFSAHPYDLGKDELQALVFGQLIHKEHPDQEIVPLRYQEHFVGLGRWQENILTSRRLYPQLESYLKS